MGRKNSNIGCSGYHYDDWHGPFYPEGMKKEEWLSFYAEKFNSVVYIRFHGKYDWYNYHYSKKELQAWKNKIASSGTRQLFAYFNNDVDAHAPENARTFKDMIE